MVAAVVLAGCGGAPAHPTAASAGQRGATPSQAAAPPPDARACAGAEATIGRLAADTARWKPTRHPFDVDVAHRIGQRAAELGRQTSQARSARVRQSLAQNALAFEGVTTAMASHRRAAVMRSIGRVRVTYRRLKQLCALSH